MQHTNRPSQTKEQRLEDRMRLYRAMTTVQLHEEMRRLQRIAEPSALSCEFERLVLEVLEEKVRELEVASKSLQAKSDDFYRILSPSQRKVLRARFKEDPEMLTRFEVIEASENKVQT